MCASDAVVAVAVVVVAVVAIVVAIVVVVAVVVAVVVIVVAVVVAIVVVVIVVVVCVFCSHWFASPPTKKKVKQFLWKYSNSSQLLRRRSATTTVDIIYQLDQKGHREKQTLSQAPSPVFWAAQTGLKS